MKRFWWIGLIVVIVVVSWLTYSAQDKQVVETLPEGIETTTVGRHDIESLISATGSIAPEHEQEISFATSGQVVQVMVEQGDHVTAGQVLAVVDDRDLRLSLLQAQAGLSISQAQLAQAKAGPSDDEVTRYEAAVTIAEGSVSSAEAGVDSAQANLNLLQAGATAEEIAIGESQVAETRNQLWSAQSQRDAICGRVKYGGAEADCDAAQASVAQAEESVRIAELQLQTTLNGTRVEDLERAQAQLVQAQAQLDQAQAQLTQAQIDLDLLLAGASADELAVYAAQVEQAQVGVDQAEALIDDVTLRSPTDGTLAQWDLAVGDRVAAASPVGTLVDDSGYHVLIAVDETDINQVQPGQEARIELDAFPEDILPGQIARIELLGDASQGIVAYQVRVDLLPTDLDVRPLMTATVDIVATTKENVLGVPNRAVRRDSSGRYVQVVRNGRVQRADIKVGISDTEYTEIVEGLEEGDEVVISSPRTDVMDVL